MHYKLGSPIFLFLFLLAGPVHGQYDFKGDKVISDGLGNTYIAGTFRTPFLTFGKYKLENSGGSDIFLAKYDNNGKVVWAENFGGRGNEKILSIETAEGNIFLSAVSSSKIIKLNDKQLINNKPGIVFDAWFTGSGSCISSEIQTESSASITMNKTAEGDTSVTIISPAGGENWKAGTRQNIQWTLEEVSDVILEISFNNGTSWQVIDIIESVQTEYAFIVPDTNSDSCLIRISGFLHPEFADTSGLISISGKMLWRVAGDGNGSALRNLSLTSSACWVAGLNGLVKSTDDGLTWESYLEGYGLFDVFFLNDNTGWSVGFYGTMFKTTDGGDTWLPRENDFEYHLYKIYFADENNGFMISDDYVLKTTDSGESWTTNRPTDHVLRAMHFINKDTGWIAGSEGVILKTTDAGESWYYQQLNDTLYGVMTSLFFTDYETGWSTGSGLSIPGGVVLKTSNSGSNWSLSHNGYNRFIYSVYFNGPDSGWAAGDEGIMFNTTDGGENWELQGSGTLADLNSINVKSGSNSWAVGDAVILKLIDNTKIPVELAAFNAVALGSAVELTWLTGTEINNKGFEIERIQETGDRRQDEGGWEKIGFVEGKGTTAEKQNYSFVDNNITSGEYSYRLKQVDYDGSFEYSEVVNIKINSPLEFELSQNYPNPFNPSTVIRYSIKENTQVILKVYDILGREVKVLADEIKPAGNYETSFNAGDLSSGTYFYSIKAGSFFETKKMLLMK